ncbi:MAG: hypothetical protein K8F51_03140 [Comamonas sp.]|nr:hypothetical protein [Comamonas sp.]
MNARRFLAGTILAAAATSAGALTLGAGHGRVVLGSPLDVSFGLKVDGDSSLEGSCISARVDMGGTPVPESRVSVHLVSEGLAPSRLRVRTDVPVNEPIVEIRLEATCSGRVSRTYTFLSDLPSGAEGQVLAGVAPGTPRRGASGSEDHGRATIRASGSKRARGAELRAAASRRRTKSVSPARSPARAVVADARRTGPAGSNAVLPLGTVGAPSPVPKLVMEPLDLEPKSPLDLRLSVDPPHFGEPGTAQAPKDAAGVWQVLNTTPQELASLGERVSEVQREVQALKEQLHKEQVAANLAREALRQAVSERYSPLVVYGLAGALALALLVLFGLMWKQRWQERKAWHRSVALNGEPPEDTFSEAVGPTVWPQAEEPDQAAMVSVGQAPTAHAAASWRVSAEDESVSVPEPRGPAAVESAAPVIPGVQEIEHPEDLFDVLQQAEFFISIGEHEQAVDGLRRHIAHHAESSPLAYFELLRLYHTLGRVAAFDELRASFEDRFNAEVPPFATFQRGGRSLEDYGTELRRIESLWGSADVVDELDRLMFRRGGGQDVARFDLSAYEDLLLLLAIAQSSVGKGRGAAVAPRRATVTGHGVRAGSPSVDTLAGDLMLEPSRRMPVQGSGSVGKGPSGGGSPPKIVAPDEMLAPDHDGVQFNLEPRDNGRRSVK